VVITENYAPNLTFVSATPPPDVDDNQWNIDTLEPGDSGTIVITVKVSSLLPGGTLLSNRVIIASDQGSSNADDVATVEAAEPAPIPTLNEWGMLIFAFLSISAGLCFFRKRREA